MPGLSVSRFGSNAWVVAGLAHVDLFALQSQSWVQPCCASGRRRCMAVGIWLWTWWWGIHRMGCGFARGVWNGLLGLQPVQGAWLWAPLGIEIGPVTFRMFCVLMIV